MVDELSARSLLKLQSANSHFDSEEFQLAVDDYTVLLRSSPDLCSIYLKRSEAYLRLGKAKEAGDDLSEARTRQVEPKEIKPRSDAVAALYLAQGDQSITNRDVDKAITFYQKAADIAPGVVTFSKIALAYYRKNEFQKALENYSKALAFESDNSEVLFIKDLTASKLNSSPLNEGMLAQCERLAKRADPYIDFICTVLKDKPAPKPPEPVFDPQKIFERNEVDKTAEITTFVAEGYLKAAQKKGVTASVKIPVVLLASGKLVILELPAFTDPSLGKKAVEAVTTITFLPAEKKGQKVSQRYVVELTPPAPAVGQ